jgi:hypothetical protein
MGKNMLSAKEQRRIKYQIKRSESATRSLLVIDNTPLRNHEIKLAKTSFKKIDQLERAILNFEDKDQKLFNEWYALTFRGLQTETEGRRQEYLKLADFHNQMVYLIKEYEYSDLEAFKILFEEEQKYESGDEKTRHAINEKRAQRNKALEKLMKNYSHSNFDSSDDFDGFDLDDDENDDLQELNFSQEELNQILNMNPDSIKKKFKSFESSFDFMEMAIHILLKANQIKKLRQIWDLAPKNFQREFNQAGKKGMGMTFDSILTDLESTYEEIQEEESSDEDENSFSFEYKGSNQHKVEKINENELLEITAIYRKIVRKIHPDHIDPEILRKRKSWFDQIWKRSLMAKERGHLQEIQQIYAKILAAFQEYESLSFFELSSLASSLNQELDHLKLQAKNLRSHPAWKFSEKKSLKQLEQKLAKPFLEQLAKLNEDIEELLTIRNILKTVVQMGTRRTKGPKKQRAHPRRPYDI